MSIIFLVQIQLILIFALAFITVGSLAYFVSEME